MYGNFRFSLQGTRRLHIFVKIFLLKFTNWRYIYDFSPYLLHSCYGDPRRIRVLSFLVFWSNRSRWTQHSAWFVFNFLNLFIRPVCYFKVIPIALKISIFSWENHVSYKRDIMHKLLSIFVGHILSFIFSTSIACIYPSVHISIHSSILLSIYPSIYSSFIHHSSAKGSFDHLPFVRPSVHLSVHPDLNPLTRIVSN